MKSLISLINQIKRFDTETITGVVGSKNGFNIVIMEFAKEWTLEDDAKVLFGIKDLNLKIDIFIPIFNGASFPKLSSINNIKLPLEIYNDAYVIFVGLKKEDIFFTQASRSAYNIENKAYYVKNTKEAVNLVEKLTKSS